MRPQRRFCMEDRNRGILFALAAYGVWGLFPLYLRALPPLGALELVSHRIFWSLLFLVGFFLIRREGFGWLFALRKPKVLRTHLISSALIAVNWLVYVWAVAAERVVECSLGYFINPLVSIGLGVFVLGERLRSRQWVAVSLAFVAILWLSISTGKFPWISLLLAFSFGGYGLVKKRAKVPGVQGLALETLLLCPLALTVIGQSEFVGHGQFLSNSIFGKLLIVSTGLATTLPLLGFAGAARRIPLSQVGFLQYITPTIQFLIGVVLFHEPFNLTRLVGFSLVWLSLALLAIESVWERLRPSRSSIRP